MLRLKWKIKGLWYGLVYGIQNLFKWFKIVWTDRDWDWTYLSELISFKMRNMARLHEKYGNTESSESISKELYELSEVWKKISKEEYLCEEYESWEKRESHIKEDIAFVCDKMNKIRNWWD